MPLLRVTRITFAADRVAAVHDYRGPLRGQLHRGGPTDSRRRAGHQRDLAYQIPDHGGACHDHFLDCLDGSV